jgi:hypothetical protein
MKWAMASITPYMRRGKLTLNATSALAPAAMRTPAPATLATACAFILVYGYMSESGVKGIEVSGRRATVEAGITSTCDKCHVMIGLDRKGTLALVQPQTVIQQLEVTS